MAKVKPVPANEKSIAKQLEKDLKARGVKPNKASVRKVAKEAAKKLGK